MRIIASLLCGLLFGAGLLISGMVQPTKVLGFLDILGAWDPSLAVVMAAALAVSVPGFVLAKQRSRPCSVLDGALSACARDRRWRVSRRCRPASSSSRWRWLRGWRFMASGRN